jgi:hypothetical protein
MFDPRSLTNFSPTPLKRKMKLQEVNLNRFPNEHVQIRTEFLFSPASVCIDKN